MSYPFEETKYLCVSSGLIGISALLLFGLKEYILSFLLGVLCITSINHWRNYIHHGIRQRIDISWVIFCGIYITWIIVRQRNEYKNYLLFSVLASLFVFFIFSLRGQKYWVVFHSSLHLYLSFFVPLMTIL